MIDKSRQFVSDGDKHRVYKRSGDVFVDHTEKNGGKNDVINLTKESGAKTIKQGVKAVKDYHNGDGPSYYPGKSK